MGREERAKGPKRLSECLWYFLAQDKILTVDFPTSRCRGRENNVALYGAMISLLLRGFRRVNGKTKRRVKRRGKLDGRKTASRIKEACRGERVGRTGSRGGSMVD